VRIAQSKIIGCSGSGEQSDAMNSMTFWRMATSFPNQVVARKPSCGGHFPSNSTTSWLTTEWTSQPGRRWSTMFQQQLWNMPPCRARNSICPSAHTES